MIRNRNIAKSADIEASKVTLLKDITATAAEINKLSGAGSVVASGTPVVAIADLGDTATGAEIAAAVNAIKDALQAFGIMLPDA